MRTACVVLTFVLVCGCRSSSDRQLGSLLDIATDDLRRGDFAGALETADRGIAQTTQMPASERAGQFRLLKAEVLILQGKLALAVSLLEETKPAVEQSPRLRGKQKYLEGRMAIVRGKLPEAIDLLDNARRTAAEASATDVLIDSEVLLGQAYLRSNLRDQADVALRDALEHAQKLDDHFRQAAALLNLGMGQLSTSYFEEALSFFNRALVFTDLQTTVNYANALKIRGSVESPTRSARRSTERRAEGQPGSNTRGHWKHIHPPW
jgi:tetratricopeptide (TPR) repeat protein